MDIVWVEDDSQEHVSFEPPAPPASLGFHTITRRAHLPLDGCWNPKGTMAQPVSPARTMFNQIP